MWNHLSIFVLKRNIYIKSTSNPIQDIEIPSPVYGKCVTYKKKLNVPSGRNVIRTLVLYYW